MRIDLKYGEGSLPLEDDRQAPFSTVIPTEAPSFSNLSSEIISVISSPKYTDALSGQIHPGSTVAISLEGPLLPEHATVLLDSTLSSVLLHGVRPDDVTIVVDLEEDRRNALNETVNNIIAKGVQFTFHNSNNESELEFIGHTPTHSVPLYVSTDFVRSTFRIGIGTITPTPFGGATGGRMAVLPGVVGEKTRYHNMKLMAIKEIGLLDIDTPCSKDMSEAADIAGLNFIVNAVTDYNGNVAELVAGDFMMAWADGVDLARKLAIAKISRRADVAIVSAGGTWKDSTLYRSVDSLNSALEATRVGGVIILVAECSAGPGSDGFIKGVSEYESEHDLILAAHTGFEPGMERARLLLRALSSRRVIICSRLRPSLVEERLRCVPVKEPQEGLEIARSWVGSKAHISVIPNGLGILPRPVNA
ncbi:MAG: DUF2088 domain-containing protein [Candidatus Thorarchaeota archaeon]|nr:DUF2088 domain-containing protein [Candidatus Thorarchaeota archaeon]